MSSSFLVLVKTKEKSLGTHFNQENWMLVIRLLTNFHIFSKNSWNTWSSLHKDLNHIVEGFSFCNLESYWLVDQQDNEVAGGGNTGNRPSIRVNVSEWRGNCIWKKLIFNMENNTWSAICREKPCPNVSTTPITAMGCRQCLPLSVVQQRGKHCWKPHCRNGVVDTFGSY